MDVYGNAPTIVDGVCKATNTTGGTHLVDRYRNYHPAIHYIIMKYVDWLIDWLSEWVIDWLIEWVIDWYKMPIRWLEPKTMALLFFESHVGFSWDSQRFTHRKRPKTTSPCLGGSHLIQDSQLLHSLRIQDPWMLQGSVKLRLQHYPWGAATIYI